MSETVDKAEAFDALSAARMDERAKVVAFLQQAARECPADMPGVAELLRHEARGIERGLHHVRDRGNEGRP